MTRYLESVSASPTNFVWAKTMARNIKGHYQSAKELNHQRYGANFEVFIERFHRTILKWMGGLTANLKEATERLKDRGALEGEFHVISDNQLLIGVDNASVSEIIENRPC